MKDETLLDLKETLNEKTLAIASDETKPALVRGLALLLQIGGNALIHREQKKNLANEFETDFENAEIID